MSATVKILLGLAIALGTGLAALYLLGSKKVSDETSLLIEAPPEEIFPWLTGTDLQMQWMSGLVKVQPIDEDISAVDSRSSVVMRDGSGEQMFENRVLRNDPDEVFSFKSSNGRVALTSVYTLEAVESDRTYFTYRVHRINKGIGLFLAPFSSVDIQERIENEARKLKELVEAGNSSEPAGAEQEDGENGSLPLPSSGAATTTGTLHLTGN
ncbi:MAG: SRPBCC family protein [Planctomycetota bacterium]